jgi:hypothetical protein
MASESIATVVRMMELLPEPAQPGLAAMARQAKQEIAEGKACPFDYDQL